MRILKVTDLNHAYVGKTLFRRAELMITDRDHIGLVGPNGCGKSTFLKILCGKVVPDRWTFEADGGLRIGYLDQYADIDRDCTAYDYVNSAFDELYELNRKVTALYERLADPAEMASVDEAEQMRLIARAQRMNDTLTEREFDLIPKKIDNVFSGLGFTEEDRRKKIAALSGGMKTKLILGKLLLARNDLLALDEPTNFLDVGYIGWLSEYLCRRKGAFVVISHDVAFLNRIANKIVEIANQQLKVYEGNYDAYVKEKARRDAIQAEQHEAQAKYIAWAEGYVAANSGEAYGGKTRTKAIWLKRMLATLERIEKPEEIVKPQFAFLHAKGATETVMTLCGAEVGYDGAAVLPPISLTVRRGEKVVFKGFNGIGKTTLLKSVYGDLPLVGGSISFGEGIEAAFLRQEEDYENNFSHFNKTERRRLGVKQGRKRPITVIEFAKEYYPEKSPKELQGALFSCGLTPEHLFRAVRALSGGEMTRLRLCLAMLRPVNLLLMDEPTNHLDVYSKEVLMHALGEFPGTVVMTTHDVNVDLSWATREINLEDLF